MPATSRRSVLKPRHNVVPGVCHGGMDGAGGHGGLDGAGGCGGLDGAATAQEGFFGRVIRQTGVMDSVGPAGNKRCSKLPDY